MNSAHPSQSPAGPASLGPVSAALQAALQERVRKHGIVIWLDAKHHYADFADRLQ